MNILPRIAYTTGHWKSFLGVYTPYVHIGIILLLGIASYVNSLAVPLQFDDYTTLRIDDSLDRGLYTIQGFIYKARWVTDITFSLNRHLHGERVLGYHMLNLAIHLSSAGVIYLFVQQAIEALKRSFQISGDVEDYVFLRHFLPFSTAALFVCHPVQTQAVTYIAQRYTSLATLLYVSSLLSYLLARLSFTGETKKLRGCSWASAYLLFALLAMKSKEIAFTLPLMVVVLEATLFRGLLLKSRLFLTVTAGLLLVIPLQQMNIYGSGNSDNLLRNIQAATTETENISRLDYLLTQFRVVVTYLRLLILPIGQNLDYDYPVYHTLLNPAVCASLLLHLTLAGVALILYIRSRYNFASAKPAAGISMRLACLGIVWFYLAMSVESSLIPIRDVIYEHRMYLPSTGFFMAVAAGCTGIAVLRQRYRNPLWTITLLICFVFTATTIARNRIWSSEMDMWQDVLEKSPNKARVKFNVGFLYLAKNLPEKALPYLVQSLELNPSKEKHWNTLNVAVSQLGTYKGRCSTGEGYSISFEKIDPRYKNSWIANSYNNLGLAYEHLGNKYQARESYKKAVTVNPSLDLAWYNLALLAARNNDSDTLTTSLKQLRGINPLLEQNAAETIRKEALSIQLVPQ